MSVIVGVTNIIPFFGPFIGAVPSAFIILIADPIKCIWFVIFVIALQQFDGNFLGPKILGQSTGLSAFWVMVAIVIGGGLMGPLGTVSYTHLPQRSFTPLSRPMRALPQRTASSRSQG